MSTEEQHEELVEALDEEFIQNNYNTDADTTCTICQAEFLDPEDLTTHIKQIHQITDAGTKQCLFCTQKYTDLINFSEHFRDNHLTSLFYCVYCLRAFSDEYECKLHEKKHKRSYRAAYCCAQCTETFGNMKDLKNHDVEIHNNNDDGILLQPFLPYLSSILNVKAGTVLLSLTTDTVYLCVCCSYSTSNIKHFIEHSKSKKCKPFVCGSCSNVYRKRCNISLHLAKSCKNNNPSRKIKCPDCKKIFNRFSLQQHKKVCEVIKCYACETQYNTMDELSEHQSREHPSSVELKACTFCWKQCVGSIALQKHMDRSHKPELHLYKYMCVYCKTPYKHPQKLFGHFFTKHKDIEPYTCKICSIKFRLRKRFTLHIKLEHKSVGFVEFDENYNVFFSDNKSENPFIPKSLFEEKQKDEDKTEDSISLLNMNSEMSVTETEGNQTDMDSTSKPTLKRKRGPKAHKLEPEETVTVESSDDESLLVVKKRVLKQRKTTPNLPRTLGGCKQKQLVINKKRFTCEICNKYCYTYQNYNHHISLHSKKDYKKCIKCSKVFRSKEKLNHHVKLHHSSSKLTDTLKNMLEKRKKGESINSDLSMSEKFRRTIKKVQCEEIKSSAKIKKVEEGLSVQKFIENFRPEAENKAEIIITNEVTFKVVKGVQREPVIKMSKFEIKPTPSTIKLSMPVKFKPGQYEKAPASIRLVQPVPVVQEENQEYDFNNYDDDVDRNESIPEVAEEVMLEGTEETPKPTRIPHKIVIPKLPMEYKDIRIAHLLPQAPFYKIVKVNDVLNMQNDDKKFNNSNINSIKLPDGTKLVNTNPLAHLLGKTPIEKVLEPMKNRYYKSKNRNFPGMLVEALSNLDKPPKKKKDMKHVDLNMSEVGSQIED